jgi:hypothetical protein
MGNVIVLNVLFGALSTFIVTGLVAIFARWAISASKHNQRARFGAFCLAIGFGLGSGSAGASISNASIEDASKLGAFLGFVTLLVILWFRWFGPRVERS